MSAAVVEDAAPQRADPGATSTPVVDKAVEASGTATDDEDEVVCRICRMEAEDDWPLYHPCRCSGSIKHVHQDCLQKWMEHSSITFCELCKTPFEFTPVYAEHAPVVLPSRELLLGAVDKVWGSVRVTARLLLVLCGWLLFIPLGTCWVCRLIFMRSTNEFSLRLFVRNLQPMTIVGDCFFGACVSGGA